MTDQEFKDYLQTLTAETVVSQDVFTHAVTSNSDFQNQSRAYLLRKRASELGIKVGSFDSLLDSFRADIKKMLKEREKQTQSARATTPEWVVRGNIDEPKFCEYFRQEHHLHFVNGAFYGATGQMDDARIKSMVQDEIAPYISMRLRRGNPVVECLPADWISQLRDCFSDRTTLIIQRRCSLILLLRIHVSLLMDQCQSNFPSAPPYR